jgi:hypothetical protein
VINDNGLFHGAMLNGYSVKLSAEMCKVKNEDG